MGEFDRATAVPPLRGRFATGAAAFQAAAEQFADRIAYVDGTPGGERLTFGEWYRRSDAVARHLVELGVMPGDVVAIMLASSIDYAITFGAGLLAGAVVTGINTRLGTREVDAVLARAQPRVTVLDPTQFANPCVPGIVVLPSELASQAHGEPLGDRRPRRSRDEAAVIIWTSGTTGTPKGAWFDHANLEAAVASAGVMSRPFDVKLVSTPFPHAGYMAKIWDQLAWVTAAVISPTPWRAVDTLRLIGDERLSVVGGVPTQWAKLLSEPAIRKVDMSSVRVGLVATAPAAPGLIAEVAATIGCPLVVRYAMTESPSICGTDGEDPPDVQFRTVGRPQAGMQIEIVDDDGDPLGTEAIGRVKVRGACVMRGYWNDPELTASVLGDDGWLMTSDLGMLRADGNLSLAGRTSDMYIRGGYNVYPVEVENVLAEHPRVERAAVIGLPTAVIGEIGVAFVVPLDRSDPPSTDELRSWVRERLADYKAPDRVEIVEDLPLTSMMKVDKAALRHAVE